MARLGPARPGLMSVYGWKTENEARERVKVYGAYDELLTNAKKDGIQAVVIALPLFLHASVAIAAMKEGLHVLTEKLMGHTVHECKEMAQCHQPRGFIWPPGTSGITILLYAQAAEKIRPAGSWATCTISAPVAVPAIFPATTVGSSLCPRAWSRTRQTNKLDADLKKAKEELKTAHRPSRSSRNRSNSFRPNWPTSCCTQRTRNSSDRIAARRPERRRSGC